jgi:hypothetical protein
MSLTRRERAIKAWLGDDRDGSYEKVFVERVRLARFSELRPISPERARDLEELASEAEGEEEAEEAPTSDPAQVRRRLSTPPVGARQRGRTLRGGGLTEEERREVEEIERELGPVERPRTRGDCAEMERPCPFASCRYHLAIDVNPATGSIKINFPHLEVWEMPETCALDVADRCGETLEEVGGVANLTKERVRQLEDLTFAKLREACAHFPALAEYLGHGPGEGERE